MVGIGIQAARGIKSTRMRNRTTACTIPEMGERPPLLTLAAVRAIAPVAGIVHALVLLLVLVVLMPCAAWIPMPVIAAVLFVVAYNMSEWRHFVGICKKSPVKDIVVLSLTFVLTVVFNLIVAIAVGLVLAAILNRGLHRVKDGE